MFRKRNGAKIFTSLILVLCLLMVFGMAALAAEGGWKELQAAAGGTELSDAWNQYFTVTDDEFAGERTITLKQDIVCTDQSLGQISISDSMPIIIDLSGFAIDRNLTTARSDGHVIWVPSGATLTIRDGSTAGTGKITGGMNTNTDYTAPGCSGGISIYGGTLKFEGGTVCDNQSVKKTGGGIYAYGGTVEMSGNAAVTGNTAKNYAGGVELNGGATMLMKDNSRITGNKATYGGGIDIAGTADAYHHKCTYPHGLYVQRLL